MEGPNVGNSKRRRIRGKQPPPVLNVSARAALTGENIATVDATRNQRVGELKRSICLSSGRDPDETALVYASRRLGDKMTLANAGMEGGGEVVVVTVPRPIRTAKEVFAIFDGVALPQMSFLVQDFVGMEGEFFARDTTFNDQGGTLIRFFSPDGRVYMGMSISTQCCKEAQWILDNRPVHLKVKRVFKYKGDTINPSNGHLASFTESTPSGACPCADCAEFLARFVE
jgi:hypothetical protein